MKLPKVLPKKVGPAPARGVLSRQVPLPKSLPSVISGLTLSILLIAGSNNLLALFQSLCLLARSFAILRAEVIFLLNLALFKALQEASLSESGMLQRRKN